MTDLRRLNELLERCPYPLPNIDDVIWKVGGFTYDTCLDLNRGYYNFAFDSESIKLCAIILPCEKSSLKRTSAWANWARAMALKSFIIFLFSEKNSDRKFFWFKQNSTESKNEKP